MPSIGATIRAKATVEVGTSVDIFNVTCTLANTEYSQTLPAGTKKFTIRCRGNARTRLAFVSGDTSINWLTIPPGTTFSEDGILYSGDLYFQTHLANQVIEILAWS